MKAVRPTGQMVIGIKMKPGEDMTLGLLGRVATATDRLLKAIERDMTGKRAKLTWNIEGVEFLRGSECRLVLGVDGVTAAAVGAEMAARQSEAGS